MAQVTIYVPDDLERQLRRAAARARKSISAYLTELARRDLRPSRFPDGFDDLFGSWSGTFPEIEDPPPDEPSPVD